MDSKINNKIAKGLRAKKVQCKRRIFLGMWTLWFVYLSLTQDLAPVVTATPVAPYKEGDQLQKLEDFENSSPSAIWHAEKYSGQHILRAAAAPQGEVNDSKINGVDGDDNLIPGYNCTNPAILEFPSDLFTQKERQAGAVVIHFLASIYVFYAIALVCDDYFVPSIKKFCGALHLPNDVAGATLMAMATSSPELFTNIIGTFITKGDIGVGAIVGSAVFNIFAVCACCGFAASSALQLDWYPLTRDCIYYSTSVLLLSLVLRNRTVFWYDGLVLVLAYLLYIIVMWKNTTLKRLAERMVKNLAKYRSYRPTSFDERTPILTCQLPTNVGRRMDIDRLLFPDEKVSKNVDVGTLYSGTTQRNGQVEEVTDDSSDHPSAFAFPGDESYFAIEWVLFWPARLIFTVTIPDIRKDHLESFYPLAFIMCMVHIGLLSYVMSWLMTIIGHTLGIPDSVMGLTFIAAGASVPEILSSVIVARQGLGSMSVSNSIGSNIFDILICLGLPWLIRGSLIANNEEGSNFIQINSGGLEYSVMILIFCLMLLYGMLALNGFYLDKKVATISTALYCIFLLIASLLELNVFFELNQPTCSID